MAVLPANHLSRMAQVLLHRAVPDHVELRRYFAYLDKVLDLKKDITFNARVNSAVWNEDIGQWTVKTENGIKVHATYLLLCSGLLHNLYIPPFRGLERHLSRNPLNTLTTEDSNTSRPLIFHSSTYPTHLSATGKRIAVIGAGATGVQIVQDLSKTASQLTLYLRRPSACLPMRNRPLTKAEQDTWRPFYPVLLDASRGSRTGIPFPLPYNSTSPTSPVSQYPNQIPSIFTLNREELEEYYTHLWNSGSFDFGARNFPDVHVSPEANRLAYDFWAQKTRSRMRDPVKRDAVAPLEPVDYLFTRRMPLEEDFYESVDRENVDTVLLRRGERDRELRFTERGAIVVEDGDKDQGEERIFDIVVLATGFDAFSGG